MDMMLLAITIGSLTLAAVSSAVAWNVVQRDRRRRDQRVAGLAAAAGVPDLPAVVPASDLGATTAAPATVGGDRFLASATPDSGSDGRQRWLMGGAAAVAALVMAIAGYSLTSGGGRETAVPSAAPLELVSMGHQRTDGLLTVTGLVRNPAAGTSINGLDAEVRVFDAAGLLVGTRTAPVATSTLAPGQDAAFAVPLGEAATAARYRVSFRVAGVLHAHVDQRSHLPVSVDRTAEVR